MDYNTFREGRAGGIPVGDAEGASGTPQWLQNQVFSSLITSHFTAEPHRAIELSSRDWGHSLGGGGRGREKEREHKDVIEQEKRPGTHRLIEREAVDRQSLGVWKL